MKKIIILVLSICLFLTGCSEATHDLYFNEQGEQVTAWVDMETSECASKEEMNITEDDDTEEYIPTVSEPYTYNVDQKVFSFYTDETVYSIPYVKINGCPDSVLEWKINHTLWEEASWIFDCAELEDHLYSLFEGEMAIHISEIYQYDHYLSIVYECGFMPELPGNIVYAIVVDVYTGERVLLSDLVQDENQCLELLSHYFDDVEAETYVPVLKAEDILFYGGMTEDETVNYNISLGGHYPESINGRIGSISYLFESASFYVTGDGLVILPGARGYTPMRFEWKSVEGAFEME